MLLRYLNEKEEKEPQDSFMESMPLAKYNGNIVYLKDFFEVAETFDKLTKLIEAKEEVSPIAFDLESTFKFESGLQPVAVLQVCIDLDNCYVMQISNLKKIPATLTGFLYHPKIILHGVDIKSNFQKLAKDFPVFKTDRLIEKCVELGEFYNEVFNTSEKWSLRLLAMHTLEEQVYRSREIQNSNWNCSPLSEGQLLHASIDVYVSQRIYYFINAKKIEDTSNGEELKSNLTESMDQLLNF
jgi:werner syndrome-like exonuclease